MKNFLLTALSATALLAFACGRNEQSERSSANYEVISEGAASGVTSTIGDAGEPLTSTNVDTTTAFTFVPPQPGIPAGTTGTSLASELPPTDGTLSRNPLPGVPSGSVARPTSPQPSISITPSRPAPSRPAPPVTAPPPATPTEPEEPQPEEQEPEEQPEEDDDEGAESDPTTTAPTTSPGDGSGTHSLLLC